MSGHEQGLTNHLIWKIVPIPNGFTRDNKVLSYEKIVLSYDRRI
jgi:hypothetical protein